MKLISSLVLLIVIHSSAFAMDLPFFTDPAQPEARPPESTLRIQTPRGQPIELNIYNPGMAKGVLFGPGQGCNPRRDMYDRFGSEAVKNGFTMVKLTWAYCVKGGPYAGPSEDLADEREDFTTALTYMKENLAIAPENTIIGGKSLGTYVAFDKFMSAPELPALILLTPICTVNGKNTFAEFYPGLEKQTRPVYMAIGMNDQLCQVSHFHEYVAGHAKYFRPLIIAGDHGFRLYDQLRQVNSELTGANIMGLARWLFGWINH